MTPARATGFLSLALAALASLLHAGEDPADTPAVPVVVAEAVEVRMAPTAWYSGSVIARRDARLSAEIEGSLILVADVGTVVEKGGLVAQIDEALLRQSLQESQAQVEREQARLSFLDKRVRRQRKLVQQKSAAESNLDEVISELQMTRSELEAALARKARQEELLRRTRILAPFGGVVTERYLQAGEWADAGKPVARLVDSRALEIQARVPAEVLPQLRPGSTLTVAAGAEQSQGTVRIVVPVGDDLSRLYEVRIDATQLPWSAGRIVRVAVPTAQPHRAVAVARDALVLRREGAHVFRIGADGKAERVTVTTGIAEGPLIEVHGDIRPGDRVVTRGGERLRPGQSVTIRTTDTP